jgi:glyoxylase-like metal-dependent hydrolase (beta-lactamase superfamily II)
MQFDHTLEMLEYPGGVLTIDSGFMRDIMAACYLVEEDGEVAFIETGTNASVPRLLRALELRGWRPEDVRYVIATHVHLDHAGGAGQLMQHLPQAEFLVHPRGARHMIDPSRLEASVRMVYGDEHYDRTYGHLVPIPAERLREMPDGATARLGRRTFTFRDTPGHARHHFCVWDDATRGWFTGDTFGLSFRELDTENGAFIFPTTTPVQFDPEAAKASLDLLLEAEPEWMYLTHFGRVGEVARLARDLGEHLDRFVEIARRHEGAGGARTDAIQNELWDLLESGCRAHGVELPDKHLREVLWPDVVINTQGVEFWLDHG